MSGESGHTYLNTVTACCGAPSNAVLAETAYQI
eukprot:CAMPEP_0179687610 /NCGR_PEP_ID=MMETSP0936-20121108/2233_1 /TAXON_ID=548131 ORGANISM="Ostreococcus mediterraneus, Strain clade-D-RCC2573" /NCGR_SAMPLE_ID=MMETSP0936 /ASSEMBLY_ACC=CAM_ASM_000574 /LENGTH=32 /DNA_ID= /DNA_START= /DNA_END= /DNA_ORIENTATION=